MTGGRFASAALAIRPPAAVGAGRGGAATCWASCRPFVGVPYGTDARLLSTRARRPACCTGRAIRGFAHAPDEHVPLEDVARCARVLAVWVLRSLHSDDL